MFAEPNKTVILRTNIALKPLGVRAGKAVVDEENECPIALMPIHLLNPKDVYTSSGGVGYCKPALKLWLADHNEMPFPHFKDQVEVEKRLLYSDLAAKNKQRILNQRIKTGLAALSGTLLMPGAVLLFKGFQGVSDVSDWSFGSGQCPLPPQFYSDDAQHAAWYACVDAQVASMEAGRAHLHQVLRPAGFVVLGLSVGLAFGAATMAATMRRNKAEVEPTKKDLQGQIETLWAELPDASAMV